MRFGMKYIVTYYDGDAHARGVCGIIAKNCNEVREKFLNKYNGLYRLIDTIHIFNEIGWLK
jgi:hypothetical protein